MRRNSDFFKSYELVCQWLRFFIACYFNIQIFVLFFKINNLVSRLILLPFCLCFLFVLLKNICVIMRRDKFVVIFSKLYIGIFLCYWLIMCGLGIYWCIFNKRYSMIIFIMLFLIVGGRIIYRNLKR